ncbi:MAG: glycosyltransferase [Rhodoferax sp.]|nr:glycosyltransferase [Rhodoferax sp.]
MIRAEAEVLTVLFVIGNLDVGGAERHLAQVLPKLRQVGFSPIVYTLTHKGKLADVLDSEGVRVVEPWFSAYFRRMPGLFRRLLLTSFSFMAFCILMMRCRPSIVHFFLPESYLFGGVCSLMMGPRIKVMSRRSLNLYQLKYPLLARVERMLHSGMNAILGNSKAVVRELGGEGVKANRLGLLYNGIELDVFDKLPSRFLVRSQLGIGQDALMMVCVANLIPYKGHIDLIHALSEIHMALPRDWVMALVGRDSGIAPELKALAHRLGVADHILWLGERSDAIAICSAADIGVLSSHQEGFSNSVLEGMAAGVAMVVTDVGGNAEAVVDGVSGLVVPARDPSALGQALLRLANEPAARERMAQSGQQRVAENFSLAACVNQYAGLYKALLSQPDCDVQQALDAAQNPRS